MAGETIISIAYGFDVKEKDDPYVAIAEEGNHGVITAAVTGAFYVDMIPALKYVPGWIPYADFKRKAKEWRKLAKAMINLPYEAAKRNIVSIRKPIPISATILIGNISKMEI